MHHRLSESPFLLTGAFGSGLSAHSLPQGVTNEIGQMHCVVHDAGRSAYKKHSTIDPEYFQKWGPVEVRGSLGSQTSF